MTNALAWARAHSMALAGVLAVLFLVWLAVAPSTRDLFPQTLANGITFGLLLALASVGLSLVYGTTGLSNFAHGEQVTLGMVLTFVFHTMLFRDMLPSSMSDLSLIISGTLAVLIAASTGWIQDWGLWGRLRARGIGVVQQMIVSIGLSLAMLNIIQYFIGGERLRLDRKIRIPYDLGIIGIKPQAVASIIISLIALGAVAYFLLKTRLGRATRAVSDNPALASASGIAVNHIVRLSWVFATGLAALGGILLALYEEGFAFNSGGRILLLMFAAVTLGGLGQAFGALAGALVIGIVSEVSTLFMPPDLRYATALGILILVLLIRPQGILGRAERVG